MQFNFENKVALVTGGSRGIGKTVAEMLAQAGARVAINYHSNQEAAQTTLAALSGDHHIAVQADIGDVAALQTMVDSVIVQLGRIDLLVNNAGVFFSHPLDDSSFEQWQQSWQRILDVNLLGPAHLTYLVGQHMIAQGGGRIVNVSSRGAFRGEPAAPAYGASKAGLNAMGQSLAKRLAPHNIFVHTVAPGFVATEMAEASLEGAAGDAIRAQSPLNRVATAEEVARTVLFCLADGTEFLTGCIIDVNGASYLRT